LRKYCFTFIHFLPLKDEVKNVIMISNQKIFIALFSPLLIIDYVILSSAQLDSSDMMTRLQKGELIIHHSIFGTPLKISFPYPSNYQRGKDE